MSRSVTYDFEGFGNDRKLDNGKLLNNIDIQVTDSYTFYNNTENDKSINILYPFGSGFSDLQQTLPVLTMNDAVVNGILLPGGYTGSFKGEGPGDDSTLNLNQIRSWDEYLTLFSDGNYLNQTVNEVLWPDQNVVIYEFTNAWADHEKAAAATMAALFDLDFNNTTVLTYGFSGGSDDRGNGTTPHSGNGNMRRSFLYRKKMRATMVGRAI